MIVLAKAGLQNLRTKRTKQQKMEEGTPISYPNNEKLKRYIAETIILLKYLIKKARTSLSAMSGKKDAQRFRDDFCDEWSK
jgi:hypothetical protein